MGAGEGGCPVAHGGQQPYVASAGRDFDPLGAELFADYLANIDFMREHHPALRSDRHGGFVALSRFADVESAARDWRLFSSAHGAEPVPLGQEDGEDLRLIPVDYDPPYHKAIRKLMSPYFSAGAVARSMDLMRSLAVELVDDFAAAGGCEFMDEFAWTYPGRVVYEALIGGPREEWNRAVQWTEVIRSRPDETAQAFAEFRSWAGDILDSRAGEPSRGDVVSMLLEAEIDGVPLTQDERIRAFTLLVSAGLDTTTAALGNIMLHLAEDQGLQRRLREEPSLLPAAIEEFLRFEAPVPAMSRTVTEPITRHGEHLEAGQRVMIYFGAANRDPRVFADPDVIDIDRENNAHLSFGIGVHLCVGRHVARQEIRIALEEILARLPAFRLRDGEPVEYLIGTSFGPKTLPLVWA